LCAANADEYEHPHKHTDADIDSDTDEHENEYTHQITHPNQQRDASARQQSMGQLHRDWRSV